MERSGHRQRLSEAFGFVFLPFFCAAYGYSDRQTSWTGKQTCSVWPIFRTASQGRIVELQHLSTTSAIPRFGPSRGWEALIFRPSTDCGIRFVPFALVSYYGALRHLFSCYLGVTHYLRQATYRARPFPWRGA